MTTAAMNKIVPTTERVFMCVCGYSGTGKTQLILSMLTADTNTIRTYNTFHPVFDKIGRIYMRNLPPS
jgi:hypothetical protein